MAIIYHLIRSDDWQRVSHSDEYRAESLESEGFIHCSQDEPQLLGVARRLYAGRSDMLVLDVDTGRLASPLRRESARSGGIFPHIYGPLNLDAVVRVRKLATQADGRFILGDEIGPAG